MTNIWRFILFALFIAAGIGLAMCVASTAPTPTEPTVGETAAKPVYEEHVLASDATGSGSCLVAGRSSSPQLEQTNSRIASQAAHGNVLLAQANSAPSGAGLSITPGDLLNAANLLQQSNVLNPPQGASGAQPPTPGLPQALPTGSATAAPGTGMSQADVLQKLRESLQHAIQMKQATSGGENTLPGPGESSSPGGMPLPDSINSPAVGAGSSLKSKPRIVKIPGEGDNNLSIHIQDSDLRDVLELLSEQGDLNILPSASVQGKVSAALNGVSIDAALNAILRSTGYVSKRDGNFIYVGTPQDFKTMAQSADSVGTRVYHLNYIRAADVQALIQPLLTPGIGTSSVTQPANEGIAADGDKAGGNQFANGDAVVVHDYVAVLNQVDQVVAEVDRKPAQVAIDAMILKITLDDQYNFGVDFAFLRNNPNVHLFTGSPLGGLDALKPNGGLQFGYLDSSTAAFVSALEQIGDTNIIASPHLMVIDKARAEILIGNQDGYVNSTITETSTAQNVQFLETGAQLRLRPFISSDGMVRMEVHPELSTGSVEVTAGPNPLTLPHKDVTQVTTNIMVPDGCTVVIGGLMRDELDTTTQQIPLLGSLPGIGFLFRHKTEETAKKEIVVLITPHIVCDSTACCEGDKAAAEFHRRQAVYADQMSPLGKRYLGRKYYRLAQAAWAKQDQEAALRFVDLAIHFDPLNRAAVDLRVDIWNGNLAGQHTLLKAPMISPPDGMPPADAAVSAFPESPMWGQPGLPEAIPPGVPFGNPPLPNLLPREIPTQPGGMQPSPSGGGTAPSNVQPPQRLESVPQSRPVPQDAQLSPSPGSAGSQMNPTATSASATAGPAPVSGAVQPLTAARALDGNRIAPWMINQLKQPAHADSTPRAPAATSAAMVRSTDE